MLEEQPVTVPDNAIPRREQRPTRSVSRLRRSRIVPRPHQQSQTQPQQQLLQQSITIANSDVASPFTSAVRSSNSRVSSWNIRTSFVVDAANVAREL